MFTHKAQRYMYHINQAREYRKNVQMYKQLMANCKPGYKPGLKRLIRRTIENHRNQLVASKIIRESNYHRG